MARAITLSKLPDDLVRFAEAQVASGRFPDVGSVIEAGLRAMKRSEGKTVALDAALQEGERSGLFEGDPFASVRAELDQPRPLGRKSLARLLAESPLKGLDLKFERNPDPGRPIKL